MVLITLDFITGMSKAYVNRELSSRLLRAGLVRSANEVLVLGALFFGTIYFPDIELIFVTFVSGFIIKELISILENLSKMGITGLDKLTNYLKDE